MSTGLVDYLTRKREKLLAPKDTVGAQINSAIATAEGLSGVRRIRIRDFQIISDSKPVNAGFDLGPAPGELLLGALAGCLNHGFLIQAALLKIELHSVEVEVQAHPLDGSGGSAATKLVYTANLVSDADENVLLDLQRRVEENSYVYNIIRGETTVEADLVVAATNSEEGSTP